MNSSSLLSGQPPTSLPTSSDTRSPPNGSRLARMCSTMNPESSPSAAAVCSGGRSGDSIAASDQRRKSSRSASSIPSSSAITVSGNGAASSATKSISSRGSTVSSKVTALLRIDSPRPPSARGVKRRFTRPRKAACSGGSMWRMEGADIPLPLARRGSFTSAPSSGAEMLRVATEVTDVLVAGDGPEDPGHTRAPGPRGAGGPAPRGSHPERRRSRPGSMIGPRPRYERTVHRDADPRRLILFRRAVAPCRLGRAGLRGGSPGS